MPHKTFEFLFLWLRKLTEEMAFFVYVKWHTGIVFSVRQNGMV